MNHNLTDKQLDALRWLVENIENGELEESFIPVVGGILTIADFSGKVPDHVNFGSLEALVADGAFIKSGQQYIVTRRAFEITAFDFENPRQDPTRTFIHETHRLILERFNREELTLVCFDLGINTDWVFGDKTDWPFELLLYLYRNNRLNELTPILKEKRPNITWSVFPGQKKE